MEHFASDHARGDDAQGFSAGESQFVSDITHHTMVHEQMTRFYSGFRRDAHPMAVMVGVVGALSAFYHDSTDIADPHQRMVASLRLIAKDGPAAFYRGAIAQAIDEEMRRTGGFLRRSDLEHYEARVVEPLTVKYRGLDLVFSPGATGGPTAGPDVPRQARPDQKSES